jgi:hypothetical protein
MSEAEEEEESRDLRPCVWSQLSLSRCSTFLKFFGVVKTFADSPAAHPRY